MDYIFQDPGFELPLVAVDSCLKSWRPGEPLLIESSPRQIRRLGRFGERSGVANLTSLPSSNTQFRNSNKAMKYSTVFLFSSLLALSVFHAESSTLRQTKPDGLRELKRRKSEEGLKNVKRMAVKYTDEQGRQDAIELGGTVYHDFQDEKVIVLDLDEDCREYLINEDPCVEDITEDSEWELQGYFEGWVEESEFGQLSEEIPYGIKMIQADQVSVGPHHIPVCVADTGSARRHPDLPSGNMVGRNRKDDGVKLFWHQDYQGHGTHVAGTVAARVGNGIGVRGVGDIPLVITRALNDEGRAGESDVFQAVRQCVKKGAKVVSMSLGGGGMSQYFIDFIDRKTARGILFVAASGNNGQNAKKYPAALKNVVAVGAVDETKGLWKASNWGDWLDVVAPGDLIKSTTASGTSYGYSYYSGTSMATPHVSGAAALLWSHHPTCTNTQIRYALAYTAMDMDDGTEGSGPGCDQKFGAGIIQVKDALDFLNKNPCDSACESDNWGQTVGEGGCDILAQRSVLVSANTCPTYPTPPALSGKKGACMTLREPGQKGSWTENLPRLLTLKPHWNHSWNPKRIERQPDHIEFLPHVWGRKQAGDDYTTELQSLIESGTVRYLLGFNEPDAVQQSNIPVEEALDLWPKLESLNVSLASPSCANPQDEWMQEFMSQAEADCRRVDFAGIHWYGGVDFEAFKTKMSGYYKLYGKPLLITEFGPADWTATTVEDNRFSVDDVLSFMKQALPWLEEQDWIFGYAWFNFDITKPAQARSALFDEEGNLTVLGRYYASVSAGNPTGDQSIVV